MSELTTAIATPYEFKHKDKTYTVSHLTQKIKAEFEQKIFARARDAALLLKPSLSSLEYQHHLKELNDEFISGGYGLESLNTQKILSSIKGFKILAALLLGISEEDALNILRESKEELPNLIRLVIQESLGIGEEERE